MMTGPVHAVAPAVGTVGMSLEASSLAHHEKRAPKVVRASGDQGACFMSPVMSHSSVATQVLQTHARQLYYSPGCFSSFNGSINGSIMGSPCGATLQSVAPKPDKNVRILSATARRENPNLVCESDYLRALLGSPDAISKRFYKGAKGTRISWNRVLTALALLTGHTQRNVHATRSRWGRTTNKQVTLAYAQGLIGNLLDHLDQTADIQSAEDAEQAQNGAFDDFDDFDDFDEFDDEDSLAQPEPSAADDASKRPSRPSMPSVSLHETELDIYPIDPVRAAQLVQSGVVKQAFAQPLYQVASIPSIKPVQPNQPTQPTQPGPPLPHLNASCSAKTPIAPLARKARKERKRSVDQSRSDNAGSADNLEPKLFDWNEPECCLALIGCGVTKMRCDYCGQQVNSTERSYHKRCKKDFSVY